eukprot:TRINITY_DN24295_c0_g1_i1.p1 TRINITY_DN24295_c0_g1~~TRINITY_DN24295_c0_g1_i1.p1  ORF type:complete len:230 (-),score=58.81 TRINITY_DN24295_c0_g1_i1:36-725(-)
MTSTTSGKPQFTLYSHNRGPNGWKVAMVLEELNLTYETIFLDFGKNEQKDESFTKYNPNGRIPAIIDHNNNDFVLWESCAIIEYLVEKYDTKHIISVTEDKEKYQIKQYLYFQASGQGPYFGQLGWFTFYHPEKVVSAQERYKKEIRRVLGVLEDILKKPESKGYLVGGKATIADISFIPWNGAIGVVLLKDEIDIEKEYPHVHSWHSSLVARPAIQKVFADRAKANPQ